METVALVILQVLRLYCTVLYNKYVYVCVVIFVIKLNLGGGKNYNFAIGNEQAELNLS